MTTTAMLLPDVQSCTGDIDMTLSQQARWSGNRRLANSRLDCAGLWDRGKRGTLGASPKRMSTSSCICRAAGKSMGVRGDCVIDDLQTSLTQLSYEFFASEIVDEVR